MDAIKKKMQAMKLEKDNAMDRADACEQQAKDANLRAERVSQTCQSVYVIFLTIKPETEYTITTSGTNVAEIRNFNVSGEQPSFTIRVKLRYKFVTKL